ncbi:MAG: RNA-binding transcriptional accessory protein [Candidatus Promineofilum sp.]|nr:RNA-binding transcriptional accessory protein [Promineifilum sp.]
MTHETQIAQQLKVRPTQVAAVVALLDDGNTLPFIARYRKEVTGSLDEEQIRHIEAEIARLRALDDRRAAVIASVAEQDRLTPDLQAQFEAAETLHALEDLYAPYRPKRRTRASIARERGLGPLADLILAQPASSATAEALARPFLSDAAPTPDEALAGARDIVAETISDHAAVRGRLRERAMQVGVLTSRLIDGAADDKASDDKDTYRLYHDFALEAPRLRPHQVLAINRGESEKVLRVALDVPEAEWLLAIRGHFRPDRRSPLAGQMQQAMDDAARRLLLPAVERDVRRALTETAERHAIDVFARNLRALLTQPPMLGRVVLGIDPGFRTGCKAAVIDPTGKVLDTATIYPHPPQNKAEDARRILSDLIARHKVALIAIGNGTASRETEQLVAGLTRERDGLHYVIVNEAGASVYSAGSLARAELPDLDVTMRGAVSIGRRLLDPLAELVKIDAKSIGVGLYQHDVDQKALAGSLEGVVESVVNQVGVEVNTASPALLGHVAGIGPKLAGAIVAHRDAHGPFPGRTALRQVPGLGPKAFEQSAGFLRIRDGDNPLDAGAIHPESYGVAERVLARAGLAADAPVEQKQARLDRLCAEAPLEALAVELGAGVPTLSDILDQLVRPGRDPREDLPPPLLRSDVLSADDLRPGMLLNGTVRNVVDFGAFIDIGVKHDGLLHRSRLPRGVGLQDLHVGNVIEVVIVDVDQARGRIGLGWPKATNTGGGATTDGSMKAGR